MYVNYLFRDSASTSALQIHVDLYLNLAVVSLRGGNDDHLGPAVGLGGHALKVGVLVGFLAKAALNN